MSNPVREDETWVRVCPECDARYPNGPRECPRDGARLLVVMGSADPLLGRTFAGRFTLKERLGRGGFGSVYRAVQHPVDREVAVKVLQRRHASSVEQVKRFFREAKSTSQLRNQHTIQLHDFGQTDDGLLYMAMELAPGRPLSAVIREEGCLSPPRAARVVAQVCDALAEAHRLGIIHRDIKPDNIMLEDRPDHPDFVKVLDFGIAKIQNAGDSASITASGVVQGTPSYMSPEQVRGAAVTPSSDLYALGVVLFQALTGRVPFETTNALATAVAHAQEPPPEIRTILPDLPAPYAALVMSLLAKQPGRRPSSAGQLRQRLLDLASEPDDAREQTRTQETPRPPSPSARPVRTPSGTTPCAPTPVGTDTVAADDGRRARMVAWALGLAGFAVLAAGILWLAVRPGHPDGSRTAVSEPVAPVKPLAVDGDPVPLETGGAEMPTEAVSGSAPGALGSDPQQAVAAGKPRAPDPLLVRRPPGPDAARRPRRAEASWSSVEIWNVQLAVTTTPPGAALYLGKRRLGEAPFRGTVAYDSGATYLTAKHPGYEPGRKILRLVGDTVVTVELRKAHRPRPAAPDPGGFMQPGE